MGRKPHLTKSPPLTAIKRAGIAPELTDAVGGRPETMALLPQWSPAQIAVAERDVAALARGLDSETALKLARMVVSADMRLAALRDLERVEGVLSQSTAKLAIAIEKHILGLLERLGIVKRGGVEADTAIAPEDL